MAQFRVRRGSVGGALACCTCKSSPSLTLGLASMEVLLLLSEEAMSDKYTRREVKNV